MKKALITGITGQDGSYLAELLLEKGYEVHGVIRRASTFNTSRIDHLYSDPHVNGVRLFLHYGDLADSVQMVKLLYELQPDEIYNLGAQSHVRVSFDIPEYTGDVDGLGAHRILEAIREAASSRRCAITRRPPSEMFGKVQQMPQTEKTPFYPRIPYGCAKVYRLFGSRSTTANPTASTPATASFSTTNPRAAARPSSPAKSPGPWPNQAGLQDKLYLGNLDAKRDWGYAKEYVEAMWLMLQQDEPDDYVVATEETHSIREFLDMAFGHAGLDWRKYVEIDPRYYRPAEVDLLIGDYSKAKKQLGWEPKTKFAALARLMVDADIKLLKDHRDGKVKVSN